MKPGNSIQRQKYSIDLITGMRLMRVVIIQCIGKVMENQSTTRKWVISFENMNKRSGLKKVSHAKFKIMHTGTLKISASDWSSSVEITEQGTGVLTPQHD